jgi:hypothetical protein
MLFSDVTKVSREKWSKFLLAALEYFSFYSKEIKCNQWTAETHRRWWNENNVRLFASRSQLLLSGLALHAVRLPPLESTDRHPRGMVRGVPTSRRVHHALSAETKATLEHLCYTLPVMILDT